MDEKEFDEFLDRQAKILYTALKEVEKNLGEQHDEECTIKDSSCRAQYIAVMKLGVSTALAEIAAKERRGKNGVYLHTL